MLAILLLGLIACESVATLKFRRVNKNHNGEIENFNTERHNHKIDILNRQKENILRREENLNNEIMNINSQKEDLDRQLEYIKKQKESLRIKTQFLNRQKEQLQKEKEKLNTAIERTNRYLRNHIIAITEGNEYKITVTLPGYNEEDIVVKSKKGLLIIEAVHNVPGEPKKNYLNVKGLPDFIEGSGKWLYMWGVLKIIFPTVQSPNKYPKVTIPLGDKKQKEKEIGNPNIIDQNIKKVFKNATASNSIKNTKVPENGEKAIDVPNGVDELETVKDMLIDRNDVKVSSNFSSEQVNEENNVNIPNQLDVQETSYAVPTSSKDTFILPI